jgi:hypothetical protein
MNLLTGGSITVRSIRTALQALAGFTVGLFVTIWAVPGVPEATIQYVTDNALKGLIAGGVSSGVITFAWLKLIEVYRQNQEKAK